VNRSFVVAFFAFEFAVRAGICVGTLTAIRIEISVLADDAYVGGDDPPGAKQIFSTT
jgi:hypothetical protein